MCIFGETRFGRITRIGSIFSVQVVIKFDTREDRIKGFILHQKILKSIHGARRYSYSKLKTMQMSWVSLSKSTSKNIQILIGLRTLKKHSYNTSLLSTKYREYTLGVDRYHDRSTAIAWYDQCIFRAIFQQEIRLMLFRWDTFTASTD